MLILENLNEEEEEEIDEDLNLEKKAVAEYLRKEEKKTQYERYQELLKKEKKGVFNPGFMMNKPQNNVSWGIIDDEEIYSSSQNHSSNQILDPKILRMLPNLTGKQIHKIEKFEKKIRKIEKLQKDWNNLLDLEKKLKTSSNDKYNKFKGDEIKEGEKINLMKGDLSKRMDSLAGELETLENKIKTMFKFPKEDKETLWKKKAVFSKGKANRDIGSDEEDEFFDRTKAEKEDTSKIKKLEEKAKKSNFSDLREELDKLTARKLNLNQELKDLQLNFRNRRKEDELDSFMVHNEQEAKKEKKISIIKKLKEVILRIQE